MRIVAKKEEEKYRIRYEYHITFVYKCCTVPSVILSSSSMHMHIQQTIFFFSKSFVDVFVCECVALGWFFYVNFVYCVHWMHIEHWAQYRLYKTRYDENGISAFIFLFLSSPSSFHFLLFLLYVHSMIVCFFNWFFLWTAMATSVHEDWWIIDAHIYSNSL